MNPNQYQSNYPPQQGGYPPQQGGGGGYPAPSQAYGTGYPPNPQGGGGYPAPSQAYGTGYPPNPQGGGGYPPSTTGGYPPQQGGYPAPSQAYGTGFPPQQGGYPPNPAPSQAYGTGFPPQQQQGGYPPQQQQGGYPPQQGGGANRTQQYPPQQQGGYPPQQQGGYPPQQGGMPPQQGGAPYQNNSQAVIQHHHTQASQASQAQQLQLTCVGKKLDNKDGMFGRSDPYIEIRNASNKLVAKSEIVMNNLNPVWKPFNVDVAACGGMSAPIVVRVLDFDSDGTHDLIGTLATTLSQLQSKIGTDFPLKPENPGLFKKKSGFFAVKKAQLVTVQIAQAYNIVFSCKKLANKDGMFGKSDPFVIVYAKPAGGSSSTKKHDMVVVGRTEWIKNNLNPTWKPMLLETKACGGMESVLVVKIYDWDNDLRHDLIGEFHCNLRSLTSPSPQFAVVNPKKRGNAGMCFVNSVAPASPDSFIHMKHAWTVSIKCARLRSQDTFSKSDPYMLIKSSTGHVFYRSESYSNNSAPRFKPFQLTVEQVGGLDSRLMIEIWDKDMARDDFNGSFFTSLRELLMYKINNRWVLRDTRKPKENNARKVGEIQVLQMQ